MSTNTNKRCRFWTTCRYSWVDPCIPECSGMHPQACSVYEAMETDAAEIRDAGERLLWHEEIEDG